MTERVIAGRYRLLERLGVGGTSSVWEAEDSELGRRVAVKLLAREADRGRFEREARAAASLTHPNVARLYDFGESDEGPFMVLELLPGGTLEDRLRGGRPLADSDTERIALEVAEGLAAAHAAGVVHRDLKPANVLFDAEGTAKLADLGIARVGGAGTLTEAGTVLGTAAYISPEQARGERAAAASDVYSFGVLLFRMLTGRLPFVSDEPIALVTAHATEAPPLVHDVRPEAPAALALVADAALAKDPAGRPPDGSALAAELRGAALTTTLTRSGATSVLPAAAPGPRRRSRSLAALAGALALAVAGVGLAWVASRSDAEPAAPPTGATGPTQVTTQEDPTVPEQPEPTAPETTAPPTTEPPPTTTEEPPPTTTEEPPPTETGPPPITGVDDGITVDAQGNTITFRP